ncbi:MAG: glycosyltransferase [Candidatus Cloacimonetes bacterium]|jgi:glycosyltransferase involved in cell wall biosynthesis|nr:glycosyltransferase [Candidatus Cloacimonadota bacterium]
MKILYISYFYPPLGGPAVLRNLKTVRYLSEAGAQITVLTVDEIEYAYSDPDLEELCRQEELIRTPSWDPMALLRKVFGKNKAASQSVYKNSPERLKLLIRRLCPIDEKIGWLPHLLSRGRKILRESEIDIIFVSCGPFSSAIAAYKLAQEFDKALVVDYRDYWTLLSDYDLMGNSLNRQLSRSWEQRILRRANLVVSATQGIADALAQSFDASLPQRTFLLYNGHDEQDYSALPVAHPSSDFYTLSYFGNIYARRSLKYLYQAIAELEAQRLVPQNLRVQLYGNFNREVYQEIQSSPIKDKISIMPELSHQDALLKMQEADALILIINSSSPKGTLTSKVFEYLRLSRPILALVPQHGEAAALLRECGIDSICPMESVSAIKLCLTKLIEDRDKELTLSPALAKYERKQQVNELYRRLEALPF